MMEPIWLSIFLIAPPPATPPTVEADPKSLADNNVCLPVAAEPLKGKTLASIQGGDACAPEVKGESNCPDKLALVGKLCPMNGNGAIELAVKGETTTALTLKFTEPPTPESVEWAAASGPGLKPLAGTSFYRRSGGLWDSIEPAAIDRTHVKGGEVYMRKADGTFAKLKDPGGPTTELPKPDASTAKGQALKVDKPTLTERLENVRTNLNKLREAEQKAYLNRDEQDCVEDPTPTRPFKITKKRKKCEELNARLSALAQTPSPPPVAPTANEENELARQCLTAVTIPAPAVWSVKRATRYTTRMNRRLREQTLCLWTTNGTDFSVVHAPTYPLPGKSLRVVLLSRDEKLLEGLKVSQEGTPALVDPILDNQVADAAAETTNLVAPAAQGVRVTRFAGRAPGSAPVLVKKEDKELHRSELLLPKTYMGSLRVGLGLVFGRAVERQYEAVKMPGSATYEIAQKDCGLAGCERVAVEFVLSYSVYLEAMIGGRDYQRHVFSRQNWGFGPLLGAGIFGQSNQKADFLKSFYMGLEFEPVRYFSISAGAVLRRVNTLGDRLHVGSALADKEIPYKTGHAWGAFLMFNFSPVFLKTTQPKGG